MRNNIPSYFDFFVDRKRAYFFESCPVELEDALVVKLRIERKVLYYQSIGLLPCDWLLNLSLLNINKKSLNTYLPYSLVHSLGS